MRVSGQKLQGGGAKRPPPACLGLSVFEVGFAENETFHEISHFFSKMNEAKTKFSRNAFLFRCKP